MSLSFGTGSQYQNSSVKMAEGVFVDKGKIRGARSEYQTKDREQSQYTDDIAVRLGLEVEGYDKVKEFYIAGNFKKEGTPQGGHVISGWGSAFKVKRLFDELGIVGEVSDTGVLSTDAVEALVGRDIFYLQYASRIRTDNGKVGYNDYRLVAANKEGETEEETRQRLYNDFLKDVEAGYVKNFHPELLTARKEDASFDFGANAGSDGGAAEAAPAFGGTSNRMPWE